MTRSRDIGRRSPSGWELLAAWCPPEDSPLLGGERYRPTPKRRHQAEPGGTDEEPVSRTIDVTLVTAAGCHYCEDAVLLLERLAADHAIRVRTVDLASPEGSTIARRLRVPFPPVVIVDGEYFGHGRISGRKLERHLERTMRGETERLSGLSEAGA